MVSGFRIVWKTLNRNLRILLCLLVLLILVGAYAELYVPQLMRQAIDQNGTVYTKNDLYEYITKFLISATAIVICMCLSSVLSVYISEKASGYTVEIMLNNTYMTDLAYLQSVSLGTTMSKVVNGAKGICNCLSTFFPRLVRNTTILIISIVYLARLHVAYIIIIILLYIPFVFIRDKYERRTSQAMKDMVDNQRELDKVLYDSVNGATEFRLNNSVYWIKNRFTQAYESLEKTKNKTISIRYARGTLYRLISAIGIGFCCVLGLFLLLLNMLTIGEFATSIIYTSQVIWVLNGIAYLITEQESDSINIHQLNEHIDGLIVHSKKLNSMSAINDNQCHHLLKDIVVTSVSFRYDNKQNVLHDINIKVPAGKKTALVGPTGSGKSTLLNIIGGIYEPATGRVCFGADLESSLSASERSSLIACVFQDSRLYTATITENIVFGKPFNADKLMECVKKAQIDDYINQLPDGFDTLVINNGMNLSGGQKQRLILARALYTGASYLMLDEFTSSLDSIIEKKIIDGLIAVDNITILVVAHRLLSLECFDRIFVLENGVVVDSGTYAELVSRRGMFAKLLGGYDAIY